MSTKTQPKKNRKQVDRSKYEKKQTPFSYSASKLTFGVELKAPRKG